MLFLIPFSSNAGRFPRQKGTGKWGVGGGTGICKEFAKRAFIIFVFVLWALVFSLRCVAPFFCPSLFSFTLVGNRPEQEHRKNTESPSRLAASLLAAAAWNSFTRGKQRTGGAGGIFAVELG